MMRWTMLVTTVALVWGGVLEAQSQPLDSAAVAALRRVLQLPRSTADAREAGVADSMIRVVLEEARRRSIPAGDAQEAVEAETDAVRAGAPKDNFGAFVQAQLAAGKRGRDLAAAVRAEHARQGHGKADAMSGEHGHMAPSDAAGAPRTRGKPDSVGPGKADSAGKRKGRGQ